MRGNPGQSQYYGNQFSKQGSIVTDKYYPVDFIEFPLDDLLTFLEEKDIKDFPFEDFSTFLRDRKVELPFPTDLLDMKVRGGRSFSRTEVMAEYFVKTYTNANDVVLDICCSDGTTGAACKSTGRKFVGFDMSPPHYLKCAQRLGLWPLPGEPEESKEEL